LGTGAISEVADMEKDMFIRSSMQDILEQRMDALLKIEAMLRKKQWEGTLEEPTPLDYGELTEVLCSGYRAHFVEEVATLHKPVKLSFAMMLVAVIYALIPSATMLGYGRLAARCSFEGAEVPEIPLLVPLSAISAYLNARALFGFLRLSFRDLINTHEALVILQRMASGQHRRRNQLDMVDRTISRKSSRIFNEFGKARTSALAAVDLEDCGPLKSTMEATNTFEPREARHRVKFKACQMRGADYHVSIGHKFRFDRLMRQVYGVSSSEHCHSFVELDLSLSDQLRMWWVTRRSIEAGLLRHKVFTELLLLFTFLLLALMTGFSVMWFGILGHAIALQFMTMWESIFIGFATIRLIKACAKVNSILESDSKRLSAIYTDLVQEGANPQDGYAVIGREVTGAVAGVGPAGRRSTLELLRVYIDHLDRDHRPLQLCGLTINYQFLSRGYLVVFSGICTGLVHLTARVLRMTDTM